MDSPGRKSPVGRSLRVLCGTSSLLLGLLATRPVHADDLADEAELRFQHGAEAYQRGDYRTALELFHSSNRLVGNKNVVFNIARSYQKLGRFPEAYRYYSLALRAEDQADARAKIEAALTSIQPQVALLRVVTEPPGAVLYVDRIDLGPRGNAPESLALLPGRYRLIAELSGYYPAEVLIEHAPKGQEIPVRMVLAPILGAVAIRRPPGATVRTPHPMAAAGCTVPCQLKLPPGRHPLRITLAGHRPLEIPVEVVPRQEVSVAPELERLTGNLLVSTDENGALIEVDGEARGFTPAIVPLSVGEHRVRVSLTGFRPQFRRVRIEQERQTRLDLELSASEEVLAASRRAESVEDAPSSVTIIPRQELRAFAYPTIAEAVRGTSGVYSWDDRSYVALGIRGLGRLGSYGNRLLVLHDGQPANDNWIGSSYVGFDATTDLEDFERIEVVRGPGSALYGTGAFSGVINLVTRRDVSPGLEAGASTHLDGVARGRVRADVRLGRDSGVWISAATGRSQGRDFFFPELAYLPPNLPGNSPGVARDVDGFEAGTTRGRWWWRSVSVQWSLHQHEKHIPGAPYYTLLGDPRTRQLDTRAFVEARAEPRISSTITLLSRVHWNYYGFRGMYPMAPADGGLEVDRFRGQWLGLEQRAIYTPMGGLRLTAGGEMQFHYQAKQSAADDRGTYFSQTGAGGVPYRVGAAYVIADAELGTRVRASAGTRIDSYTTFGSSVNPRLALVVRPYDQGNSKLLVGKAFRAPSIYELYYDGGVTQLATADLGPESIYSVELEHSHRFTPTVTGTASFYLNYVKNLVDIRADGDRSVLYNSSTPLAIMGSELGLKREWRQGWMVAVSYTRSAARFLAGAGIDDLLAWRGDSERREVSNVPVDAASLKAAIPILSRNVTLASRWVLEGPRWDRYERVDDPLPQERSDWAVIWDLALTGHDERWHLDWALGAYNLFDWHYRLPVGAEFRQRTMVQNGRTFLASLAARF